MSKKSKSVGFDIATAIADTLDEVAKRQGFESSSLEATPPISSGMLALDLILGGGLRPGMLTAAGEEQCAKSTVALTAMAAAINSGVPFIGFVDYEGCVTSTTRYRVDGQYVPLNELVDLSGIDTWLENTIIDQYVDIDTSVPTGIAKRRAQLIYRGVRPVTRITLENDQYLDCYNHPIYDADRKITRSDRLQIGQTVSVDTGFSAVKSIEVLEAQPVFDLNFVADTLGPLNRAQFTNGIITHNSTKSSLPYIQQILKGQGVKLNKDQVFGKRNAKGEWEVRPRVRFRAETSLEKFYEWVGAILREFPDKRYVEHKWWLVYDDTKKNKAKYGEFVDQAMNRKYGNGLWIPAPDGNLQGLVIVDSYTAMNPDAKDQEDISNQLSVKASAFSKQLERIKGRLLQKMVLVYGLNHLRANPMAMYGPKETEKGGKALQQFSDVRFRQTSRALSAAPFSPKAGKKMYDEQEQSVEYGGKDRYRYVHVKAIKNKLWVPQRECFVRIWVEDGSGTARGLDPVFDTIYYLKQTGQIKGTRKKFTLNLEGVGKAKKPLTWDIIKKWVLGDKETMVKISKFCGYKPMSLRKFCFVQIRKGVGEELYVKTQQENSGSAKDDEDED